MKKIILITVLASINTIASAISPLLNEKIAPISIDAIYSPLKADSTADEALMTGTVKKEVIHMTTPASRPWRIAFLFPHLKDPYWIGSNYGVISEAMRLGIQTDIFVAKGYNDVIGQLIAMDDAIAAKYDAIVISPLSLTSSNNAITKAKSMGIPVFELANDSSSDALTTKVTTSLKGMGLKAMQWIIQDAQRRDLTSINIALLPGPENAAWVKGEVDGTMEAIQKASIKVNLISILYGDSDHIIQSQLARNMLLKFGNNIHYIIGCSGCAPAAVLPLKEMKLQNKIKIVAYDLTQEVKEHIRKGNIVASVDTKAVSQARVAINTVVNFLEKRKTNIPHTMLINLDLVDTQNFAKYPFHTSIAPQLFTPKLSYKPMK